MKETKILIVDDDPAIRKFVRANLEARDYEVLLATNGEEGLKLMEEKLPNLILLDIMMPGIDGFEVCRQIREWSEIPIIMLSARDGEMDKVKCLDYGADDYLTKPFSLKELLSRIKAILRRAQNDRVTVIQTNYINGELEVNLAQNRVILDGEDIYLTGTQYKILSYLVINAGRVITPDQILARVWGEEYIGDNHIIQVNMARLRDKLNDRGTEPRYIECRRGIGYVLKTAVPTP